MDARRVTPGGSEGRSSNFPPALPLMLIVERAAVGAVMSVIEYLSPEVYLRSPLS